MAELNDVFDYLRQYVNSGVLECAPVLVGYNLTFQKTRIKLITFFQLDRLYLYHCLPLYDM